MKLEMLPYLVRKIISHILAANSDSRHTDSTVYKYR